MKRNIFILLIIIVVIALIVTTLISNKKEIEARKVVTEEQVAILVNAATTTYIDTDGILHFVGVADASKDVMIPAEAGGAIKKINFRLGDVVKTGDVLVEVDDVVRRLSYESAKLNYDKFEDDLRRFKSLRQGDAITETQLRDMQLGYDAAKIALQQAEKALNDTRVVAPFGGYITSKNVELGGWLNVGQVVAGLVDISELKVVFHVSENNVYQLRTGQRVKISADVYPDTEWIGVITNISPKGSAAHTYPIEVTIKNSGKERLKAGTYVNIRVDTDSQGKVLCIPRNAIISSIKDPSVYKVVGDRVVLQRVMVGRNLGDNLEVLEGLGVGDVVVTDGQINLMDGSLISISNQ